MSSRWPYLCLLLVYSMALIRPLWPLVDYGLQQDYYAQVLCFNKMKPELGCNGQCVLMKRLLAEVEKERPQPYAPSNVQPGEDAPHDICTFDTWNQFLMNRPFFSSHSDACITMNVYTPPTPPPRG